jgi:hypothetical protein
VRERRAVPVSFSIGLAKRTLSRAGDWNSEMGAACVYVPVGGGGGGGVEREHAVVLLVRAVGGVVVRGRWRRRGGVVVPRHRRHAPGPHGDGCK